MTNEEIIEWIASGCTAKQIAKVNRSSFRTVENRILAIRKSWGAENTPHLIFLWMSEKMAKNFPPRGAGTEQIVSTGGDRVISVPKNATTAIETVPGRLCRAVVTTAGTDAGIVTFVDSPDAASVAATSNVTIAALPGTVAIGAIFDFQMPFKLGCVCVSPANGPALAVSVIVNG